MDLDDIAALPIPSFLRSEGYLFLWTTNRYLEDAYRIIRGWGCRPSTVVVWCKPPRGQGPGGMFAITTEFVVVAQRINPGTHAHGRRTSGERIDSSWFEWPRRGHSTKPEEFFALVERVASGPYLEMFARRPRLGWDIWGDEAPGAIDLGLTA
jgi:N6-adenosine-specific RNA methylase IME4